MGGQYDIQIHPKKALAKMLNAKLLIYLLLIQAITYSTGDHYSYESSSLILTSTSLLSLEGIGGLVIKGYIDCHFYEFRNLHDVYQFFEDEAKKLCASAVFDFSLNPI